MTNSHEEYLKQLDIMSDDDTDREDDPPPAA
jgi:hypothetical protein